MDSKQIEKPMKEYTVWDSDNTDKGSTVVFAKTAQEAKKTARLTGVCEDAEYINIRVKRTPEMDKYFQGRTEVDWENPEDRKALISLGWTCFETSDECESCPGKAVCSHW